MKTMLTMLTTTIKMIIKEARANGQDIFALADKLDMVIVDTLIDFCVEHPSFHSYHKAVEFYDMGKGHFGSYCNYTGEVQINSSLVEDLVKDIAIGIGDSKVSKLVETMLHEHRHCYQHRNKLPMCKVEYVDAEVDYEAYYNHPMEVDARKYAALFTEQALEYIIYTLKRDYLSHN